MKKYILKDGKEIKFGDIVDVRYDFKDKNNPKKKCNCLMITAFDEDSIDMLKALGIIREVELKEDNSNNVQERLSHIKNEVEQSIIDYHLDSVVQYVASKLQMNKEEAITYLECLEVLSPMAVLDILLKRISVKLNKKYDHTPIRNLSKIYAISRYDGKVTSICPKDIKNLKHFAWFRAKEDADFARVCVKKLIEKMFGKDDQPKDK